MVELIVLARRLDDLFTAEGWEFCIIGGVALQVWGEERFTKDVDITLFTGFGGEEVIVDKVLKVFAGRRPDAREFALLHRVLLLQSEEGYGIDISLGALPFEQEAVRRAKPCQYGKVGKIKVCTAEDLIVMKAFASRGQDWVDIERVLVRQKGKLDWEYILRHLADLVALKEEPEIVNRLLVLRTEVDGYPQSG